MTRNELERRYRILDLLKSDAEFCEIETSYKKAEAVFEELTDQYPENIRNILWAYPGLGYLLHNRMLTLICEHMKFEDEDEKPPQL